MKKKIFISYKFTGENPEEVKLLIPKIHNMIEEAGHDHYSTIFDSKQFENEKWSRKQIMDKAYKEINESDLILFFINSTEISHGMLLELGYANGKNKRTVLAIKRNIKNIIFRKHIKEVIEYDNLDELKEEFKKMNL